MTAPERKPWQDEWDALSDYTAKLRAKYADPFGADNWAYDREKQADPEFRRLMQEFRDAKAAQAAAEKAERAAERAAAR